MLTCIAGDYCLITEGGVVLPDAANTPNYRCNQFPGTCNGTPSCKCLSTTQPSCQCVESSAGFTVTCAFP